MYGEKTGGVEGWGVSVSTLAENGRALESAHNQTHHRARTGGVEVSLDPPRGTSIVLAVGASLWAGGRHVQWVGREHKRQHAAVSAKTYRAARVAHDVRHIGRRPADQLVGLAIGGGVFVNPVPKLPPYVCHLDLGTRARMSGVGGKGKGGRNGAKEVR